MWYTFILDVLGYMKTDININGPTAVVGDIHGVAYDMNLRNLPDNCNIILLGDVGVGFNCSILFKLSTMWPSYQFYLIRGNHDDPSYWEDAPFRVGRNVNFVPDGYLTINGDLYLAIGGSISVDKNGTHRIPFETWWEGEEIQYKIPNRCKKVKGILAHTGPKPSSIPSKVTCKDPDGSIQKYIDKEKEFCNKVIRRFKPEAWYHGHYHVHEFWKKGKTDIYSLDCNEVYLL